MDSFWDLCQERFRANLTQQQFSTWIKPLVFDDAGGEVRILAPNHFVMDWVREKFAEHIDVWAQEFYARPVAITYALGKKPVASRAPTLRTFLPLHPAAAPVSAAIPVQTGMRINPGFNFDNFVSGRANQLARAAALQIADNPGVAYNPLFVYGGVGLGKTHLLQAIGNTVRQANPDARISYIHANDYVDDVVKAYLNKQFDDLKRRYMSLDLLLIDDIQFLAKKDRTQEEFFYVFNSLIENKKQIVITCDTFPKEITGLDDRLKSRFAWGLTVAVEPPELEMRVAILLAKAQAENIKLDENVAFFIAKQVRSNVRELEGALEAGHRVFALPRKTDFPGTGKRSAARPDCLNLAHRLDRKHPENRRRFLQDQGRRHVFQETHAQPGTSASDCHGAGQGTHQPEPAGNRRILRRARPHHRDPRLPQGGRIAGNRSRHRTRLSGVITKPDRLRMKCG